MGFYGLLCKPVSFKVLKHAIEGAFDKINKPQQVQMENKSKDND